MDIKDQVFSVREAAQHLKISRAYLYTLIAHHKIRVAKLGARTMIPGKELLRFVRQLEKRAA